MSEVRGRNWEDPMPKGRRPRGVTPRPRSGGWQTAPGCDSAGAAERSYPPLEARGGGWEEQPYVQGTVAAPAQEGLEELFHVKVRRGHGEEILLVQDKEQGLCFAGAAMKRYPTSKVRETQVRW